MALPTVSSASIATSNLIVVLQLLYFTETYWLLLSCSTMCTSRMQVFQVVCKVKLFIWPCTIYLLSLPVAKCLVCLSEARTVSLSATSLPPYTQTQQSFFVLLCQEISGHNIEKMGKKGGERIKRLDSASVGDYSKPVCRFSKCERVDTMQTMFNMQW